MYQVQPDLSAAPGVDRARPLLETEWVLTNALGGYAMGTASGVPTRRYHGLLVAALSPPVQRVVALSAMVEWLVLSPGTERERRIDLSSFRFAWGGGGSGGGGALLHPGGVERLVRFERTTEGTCQWQYEFEDGGSVVRQLHLFRGRNTVALRYLVRSTEPWVLEARPLVALRDFHHLVDHGREGMFHVHSENGGGGHVRAWRAGADFPPLSMLAPRAEAGGQTHSGAFRHDPQWWRRFFYEAEHERGMEAVEDLFSPGVFISSGPGSRSAGRHGEHIIYASTDPLDGTELPSIQEDERQRGRHVASLAAAAQGARADEAAIAALAAASDDYVVVRQPPAGRGGGAGGHEAWREIVCSTVIAGYPWFADWGRDTMISLPGLMLATGRGQEALLTLRNFAVHCRDGVIPNRFDDQTSQPHYNTADASLWFLHACAEYARLTGDVAGFRRELLPACLDVVHSYRRGTFVPHSEGGEPGGWIGMDPADHLISAGSAQTQLTWMDARRDGVVFTPRHGKAVELNALWRHGLASLAEVLADAGEGDRELAADLRSLASAVSASFRARFFDHELGCCVDRLAPAEHDGRLGGWSPVREIRPNQIFAVSLRHGPLTTEESTAVVRVVRERLLTRHGLRTLDPTDPGYKPRFTGTLFERDAAYHTGTAWPWLLPALAEAMMRVEGFSEGSRRQARELLQPLIQYLQGPGCGQLPEVFDGEDLPEAPQRAGGCPAQAWSIAELLRVLLLTRSHP